MIIPVPRRTIRLRLTLLYGGLFVAAGAALLAVTYVLVAHPLPWMDGAPPEKPDLSLPVHPPAAPRVPTPGDGTRADESRAFLVASGLGLAAMTVASVGLGWLMAGRVLRPLRTMTATAREISARSLHRRLGVRGPADEIKDLADTFDGLLDRLEAAFDAQRAFVANASHELRTPLTFERSLLEVTLADPDVSAAELREACGRVLASNARQERVIAALLTLARGQRGLDERKDVDLRVLTESALGADRAPGPRIEPELHPARTLGDPRLVERLITNLVDNAVRHNVPDGRVHVWTGTWNGRPGLRVVNTGPVIPPDQVDALFQPFRRLDPARTGAQDGLGLGLSIVAAIAAAHDAELDARPAPGGGLDLEVIFPSP